MVLDAGALIGIDRNDRRIAGLIELGRRAGAELTTVAPVVAQAWRDGARQAQLSRWLNMVSVQSIALEDAKRAGELLGQSHSSDVVDALLVLSVQPTNQVLTSDPGDIGVLLAVRQVDAVVVNV